MRLHELMERKTVLTHEDVLQALDATKPSRQRTKESLVRYHLRSGRLLRVRRGLYLVVPPGATRDSVPVDALLLAAKAAPDGVLAYHTALEFHGRAHSSFQRLHYLSQQQQRPWTFRDYAFQRVAPPKALIRKHGTSKEVKIAERSGETVHVTSLERTLVDVLDRPDLAGGHEELWRSLELVEYFDLDRVVEYALLLDNATTVAKVGFYLDQHRKELMVEESHLRRLRAHRPKQPHYLDRTSRGETKLAREWNLVVPRAVFERSWEELR